MEGNGWQKSEQESGWEISIIISDVYLRHWKFPPEGIEMIHGQIMRH